MEPVNLTSLLQSLEQLESDYRQKADSLQSVIEGLRHVAETREWAESRREAAGKAASVLTPEALKSCGLKDIPIPPKRRESNNFLIDPKDEP